MPEHGVSLLGAHAGGLGAARCRASQPARPKPRAVTPARQAPIEIGLDQSRLRRALVAEALQQLHRLSVAES